MKAVAVKPLQKQLDLVDIPAPDIASATEVRLQVLEVGVCGTDREIARFEYGTPPEGSDFLVMGHESLMRVEKTGPAVNSVKPGDIVVLTVRRPCQESCIACRLGRQDFCYTGNFAERGIKGRHGYMTELVVEDESYVVPLKPELRDIGVLTEPLTIAEKALAQVWEIQARLPWDLRHDPSEARGFRHKAVVLGAGPVALLGTMALVVQGFDTCVYSREAASDPRAAIVQAIGASYISSADVPIGELVTAVERIDLIYEATGASKFSFDMAVKLGANGIFIFTGVPGRKEPVEIDTDLLMRRMVLQNQIVFGTVNAAREAFQAAVADLERFNREWPDALHHLITGHFPIESYREVLQGQNQGIKDILVLSAEC